jgi:hypothetical protein
MGLPKNAPQRRETEYLRSASLFSARFPRIRGAQPVVQQLTKEGFKGGDKGVAAAEQFEGAAERQQLVDQRSPVGKSVDHNPTERETCVLWFQYGMSPAAIQQVMETRLGYP